jgi:hypothetical protein
VPHVNLVLDLIRERLCVGLQNKGTELPAIERCSEE